MTGNLKLLCNFVEKFLGTVRFGNDQFAPILGYGDLKQGNVMIKRDQLCSSLVKWSKAKVVIQDKAVWFQKDGSKFASHGLVWSNASCKHNGKQGYILSKDIRVYNNRETRLIVVVFLSVDEIKEWMSESHKFRTSHHNDRDVVGKWTLDPPVPKRYFYQLGQILSGEPVDQSDYRSKIGSLMYLTSSRPDIVQAVCYCARYQARPTQKHLKEVKRIFKYLKGTINMGLWYPKDSGFELTAFSDADHAGCIDTRKSTSAEAEYVALSASCAQVMWMRTQLQDYGFNYNKIPLYCDSQSAIAISCNPVQHSRTKHIHTRYHFIKEQVENGIIELYFVRTEYQLADMFTKALPEDRFKYLVRRIGMRCLTPAELEVLTNETA
ncbi:hypothetical protein Tco_0190084 [Tanacetum coccineum]